MILYHGGSAASPKVNQQKELGIHCSPNALEADVHFVKCITKCDADVSGAVNCEDMNDWASLEAFYAILQSAGVAEWKEVATQAWRSNNCQTNTKEASAVMRNILLEYGIEYIKYIDIGEVPGAECYILLTDQSFKVVMDLAEGYPNLAVANDYLPEDHQIEILFQEARPHIRINKRYKYVPKSLFTEDPKSIADYLLQLITSEETESAIAKQKISELANMLALDYDYEIRTSDDTVVIFTNSDSWLDLSNPRVSIHGKVTSVDKRYSRLSLPVNCDLEKVYTSKVTPFIDSFIQ